MTVVGNVLICLESPLFFKIKECEFLKLEGPHIVDFKVDRKLDFKTVVGEESRDCLQMFPFSSIFCPGRASALSQLGRTALGEEPGDWKCHHCHCQQPTAFPNSGKVGHVERVSKLPEGTFKMKDALTRTHILATG